MARQLISSGSPFEQTVGFSRAVRVGNLVSVAGTAPIWPDGSCDPDPYLQSKRCLEIISAALAEAGATLDDVVRTRIYITDAVHGEAAGRAHGELFSSIRPASTMIVIAGLLRPEWKVEFEADAIVES